MKRGMIVVLLLYLFVAALLFVFMPEQNDEVRLLSKERYYAQIIDDENEPIEIVLYVSENDSFLTDSSQIIDARIVGEYEEIELKIQSIDDKEAVTNYQNQDYHLFAFTFSLAAFSATGVNLSLYPATLALTYENDVKIDINIGEMTLLFQTIDHNPHFDFFRLYGIYGEMDGEEIMQGIGIGFNGFSEGDLVIHSISIGTNRIGLATDLAQIVDNTEESGSLYERLEGLFDPYGDELYLNSADFIPQVQIEYEIPFSYLNPRLDIWRFPIIINYQYLGIQYQSFIDDFMFHTMNHTLEDSTHVHTYTHRY